MTENITVILAFILAIPLWILYHKIFTVIYHRNLLFAILGEFMGALLTGYFLAQFLVYLFGALIAFLLKILLFLLKAALTIGAVSAAVWIISFLIFLFQNHLPVFTSADLPALSEKKVRDACSGPIPYSFWVCAYAIYHHRILTLAVLFIGAFLIISNLVPGRNTPTDSDRSHISHVEGTTTDEATPAPTSFPQVYVEPTPSETPDAPVGIVTPSPFPVNPDSLPMFLGTDFNVYDYSTMTRNVDATQSLTLWLGTDSISNDDIEMILQEYGVDPAPYLNGTGFAYGFDQYSFDLSMREEIVMDPTGKYDPYLYMNQNYDALVEACSKFLAADGSIYDNATQELDLALTDSYYSWFEDFEAALPREITLVMLQHGVNPEPYLYEYAYDDDITFNSPA